MSCINVSVARIGGINASSERLGGIMVSTSRIGGIDTSASRIGGMTAVTTRKGGISVNVGLICAVGYGKYLRVTPKEVQWIDIETSAEYRVLSNLDWNII